MWDWSKDSKKPNISLLYNKYINTDSILSDNISHKNLTPIEMQSILYEEISKFNLSNIQLRQCNYIPHTWKDMNKHFNEYLQTRRKFLQLLGYSFKDKCLKFGFSEEDIEKLKNGICPENHNAHIKIPFDFGGNISFDNLCLIKTHPLHIQLHSLIEFQIGSGFLQQYKIIYIPWIKGYFYND